MIKKRAKRKHHEKRVQKKRRNVISWKQPSWNMNERQAGHLKNNHYGCGCSLCKSWKHGYTKDLVKYKFSERKKIMDDSDE